MPRKRPHIICPATHSHGENSTCRSLHGCCCHDCRDFAAAYEFWRQGMKRAGHELLIAATGTHRRIRALHRVGYSQHAIAVLCARSDPWVTGLMRNRKVKPTTAALIQSVYDRYSMLPPVGRTRDERAAITRTRRYAERMGWAGPLHPEMEDLEAA